MELLLIGFVAVMLLVALLFACGLLLWLWLDNRSRSARLLNAYNDLRESYKDIIDRDAEIAKRDNELAALDQQSQTLNAQTAQVQTTLEQLQRELALTEETLNLQSYGLYKPHFDFATSEAYKVHLQRVNDDQKRLILQERATVIAKPWIVNGSSREGERMTKQYIKLMLRAFNGECDAAILKVRWNNAVAMEERIKKAFEAINRMGAASTIEITNEYLNLKLDELRLTYEYQEKLYQEREEQRRIQEQMREEEKVRREIEQAQRDAEADETRYQRALNQARAEMEQAKGAALEKLNQKVTELEQQLQAAQAAKARAIAQAQLTKRGNVYVISNVGSFGENVFKIGMTRRLEPMDRVRELGDAAVPFDFDVHAIIFSEDAPSLENAIQVHFKDRQVNLIDHRKEFFYVSIDEVEEYARKRGLKVTVTKVAEAREYRETLAMRSAANSRQAPSMPPPVPNVQVSTN